MTSKLATSNISLNIQGLDKISQNYSLEHDTDSSSFIKIFKINSKIKENAKLELTVKIDDEFKFSDKYRFTNKNFTFTNYLKAYYPDNIPYSTLQSLETTSNSITIVSTISTQMTTTLMPVFTLESNLIGAINLIFLSKFLRIHYPDNLIAFYQGDKKGFVWVTNFKNKITFNNENKECANSIDYNSTIFAQNFSIYAQNNLLIISVEIVLALLIALIA